MTTNISDLPGGNSNQPSIQLHTKDIQKKKPSLSSINEMVSGLQKAASNNMTRLPERDIPLNPQRITHDQQIQPNFIPPPPENPNYIEDEMDYEYMMRRNSNENQENEKIETIYDELQTPLVVCVLYFLFQLPFVNKSLHKFVPTLFNSDGNPKFGGFLFKTFIFGVSVFIAQKTLNMASEF